MPSVIRVELWCDPCSTEDVWVEGEHIPAISIDGAAARRLILCPKHRKEVFEPLSELLASPVAEVVDTRVLAATEASLAEGRSYFCPIEDCERHIDGYKSADSLRKHLYGPHGMSREEANEVMPATSRAAYGTKKPSVVEAVCPECGRVFTWPNSKIPMQSRGVHMNKAHGIVGKDQYAPDGTKNVKKKGAA